MHFLFIYCKLFNINVLLSKFLRMNYDSRLFESIDLMLNSLHIMKT